MILLNSNETPHSDMKQPILKLLLHYFKAISSAGQINNTKLVLLPPLVQLGTTGQFPYSVYILTYPKEHS